MTRTSSPAADTSPRDTHGGTVSDADPVAAEQPYVAMLYGKLDDRRAETAGLLARVLRDETTGTPQAVSERDAAAQMYSEQLATLSAVENGLCFGRLDLDPDRPPPPPADGVGDPDVEGLDQDVLYVGRLGLLDEDHDYEPLLIDWRAPAARPYYTATAASPDGVRRRRHIRSRSRRVTAVDDEILDLEEAAARRGRHPAHRPDRRGGAARGAVGRAHRADGRHRRDHPGRAGPGHPLQRQRRRRGRGRPRHRQDRRRPAPRGVPALHPPPPAGPRGVLVVGPNPTFLRYIEQVLPSLGETSVLLSTVGELYPGLAARRAEPARRGGAQGPRRHDQGALHRGARPPGAAAATDRARRRRRAAWCSTATSSPRPAPAPGAPGARTTTPSGRSSARSSTSSPAARSTGWAATSTAGRTCSTAATSPTSAPGCAPTPTCGPRSTSLWPTLSPPQLLADLWTSPQRLRAATRGWRDADRDLPRPRRAAGRPVRRQPGGARRTRCCSTRSPSCSARTTPPPARPRSASGRPTRPTRPASWRSSRWRRTGTPSCCVPPTSSTPACSPTAPARPPTPRRPSVPPTTAPGRSAT